MHRALETARIASKAGGAVLRARRDDVGAVRSKGTATDFVTESDIASGIAVARAILERDPGARLLVEEPEVHEAVGVAPASLEEGGEVWAVDPLDGTTSFLHGFPCYSVSVALVRDGLPVAGAVYNAALDEMVSAAQGLGATVDGRSVHCTAASAICDALVVTGFPYDRTTPLDRQLAVLASFLRAPVHGIRRDGSAAIDCTHVAIGRADGFWEYTLKPWDLAAGVIVCREAGAVASDVAGRPWDVTCDTICVANPRLHPLMLKVIAGAGGA